MANTKSKNLRIRRLRAKADPFVWPDPFDSVTVAPLGPASLTLGEDRTTGRVVRSFEASAEDDELTATAEMSADAFFPFPPSEDPESVARACAPVSDKLAGRLERLMALLLRLGSKPRLGASPIIILTPLGLTCQLETLRPARIEMVLDPGPQPHLPVLEPKWPVFPKGEPVFEGDGHVVACVDTAYPPDRIAAVFWALSRTWIAGPPPCWLGMTFKASVGFGSPLGVGPDQRTMEREILPSLLGPVVLIMAEALLKPNVGPLPAGLAGGPPAAGSR